MGNYTKTVSVLGTGDFGSAIIKRLIKCGKNVVAGSRYPQKRQRHLSERDKTLEAAHVVSSRDCIMASDIIIAAIPSAAANSLKEFEAILRGKIIIDVSNTNKISKGKSNAEQLSELLPASTVVKCFNTLSAYTMEWDLSNEQCRVHVCSDDPAALELVGQLSSDMGFTAIDAGTLRNARQLESMTHILFRGWGLPTLFTLALFVTELIYLFISMYVLVDRYDVSQIPTYVMYKACGAICVNLLAFCYLPGALAAFVQIYNGSKHTRFPSWLDQWLQGRKQLGRYALLFAFLHMITVMSCLNGAYFSYLFKTPTVVVPIVTSDDVTVPANVTVGTMVAVDTKMNLHGEGCIITGLIAITTLAIVGLTSVPAIGSTLNWREWRFIHCRLGFVCFLLTVCHCMVHGVPRWTVQRDLVLRNSFMSLIIPWLTIILKIIYFIPCVHAYVWRIRRGYERGVEYDAEQGDNRVSPNNSPLANHSVVDLPASVDMRNDNSEGGTDESVLAVSDQTSVEFDTQIDEDTMAGKRCKGVHFETTTHYVEMTRI